MSPIHKQRLVFVAIIIFSIVLAVSLALYALQQNVNLFFSPTQVAAGLAPSQHEFRLGGLVQKGSIQHSASDLLTTFIITDKIKNVTVSYKGILPDLFREGQSVIVEGKLNSQNSFIADQVLAKHDEKYMPPQVSDLLSKVRT